MDDFEKSSNLVLDEVSDFFETSWPDADVDSFKDAVVVDLPHKLQYVINKHGVSQQIWVSSPFTGAHHFYLKEGVWRCTRKGETLQDLLELERKTYAS